MIPPKRYLKKFVLFADNLRVGNRTEVEVLAIRSDVVKTDRGYTDHRITAIVELSAVVTTDGRGRCAICQVKAPALDHSYDSLWFTLTNHDGQRIVSPDSEDTKDERDRYPVTGWFDDPEGLICGDCRQELQAAREAIKARKKL